MVEKVVTWHEKLWPTQSSMSGTKRSKTQREAGVSWETLASPPKEDGFTVWALRTKVGMTQDRGPIELVWWDRASAISASNGAMDWKGRAQKEAR